MIKVKNINLLAHMFAQPFIAFGDLGLIKYVGIRFWPSLLIVFQTVFCFEKKQGEQGKPEYRYVWLQFLKVIFYSQNTRTMKTEDRFNLVPFFVCFEKHIKHKTLNSNDKNSFQKIQK